MPKERSPEFEEVRKHLKRVRKGLKDGTAKVEGVEFSDEAKELLKRETTATREILDLFGDFLRGISMSAEDIDAALFRIEQRRQYGDYCLRCGDYWTDAVDAEPEDHVCSCPRDREEG